MKGPSSASIVGMLRSHGCTVEVDADGLVITAPKGRLTDGAKQVIRARKADIEAYLRSTELLAKPYQPSATLTGQTGRCREDALFSILPSPVRHTVHRLKSTFADLGDGLTLIEAHRGPETLSGDLRHRWDERVAICKEEGRLTAHDAQAVAWREILEQNHEAK